MQLSLQKSAYHHRYLKPLLLFLLGSFCVFGFAPFYVYPASIISLSALFYFWHQAITTKESARAGFYYGLGLFGTGIYWIYISLHDFGSMPALMAGFSTFTLCAFLALFPAMVGWTTVRLRGQTTSNQRFLSILMMAVLWALSEWVRSWIFTGFPWLTVGYTQVPFSPLAGYMPIFGVYGVSLITALIASSIAYWVAQKPQDYAYKRNTLLLLSAIWLAGSLAKQIPWTTPAGETVSVALLQGNIAQSIKWDPEVAGQTLNKYLAMAEASQAKLIILPETALPVLSTELPAAISARLKQRAIQNQGDVLVGLIEREHGEYFNSMLSLGSAKTQVYRKSHLVPFGEFIPLKAAFGWIYRDWLNMPLSDLSRGATHQQPMHIAGQKVAVNICYEDVFGEEIIRQLPAATLLVNTSNDAWYGESLAAYQHLQLSQTRALETGRMMLRATNTGATAMIGVDGKLMAHSPHFKTTTLEVTAQGYRGSTPYVRFGNWPFLLFCFCVLTFVGMSPLWRRHLTSTTARR